MLWAMEASTMVQVVQPVRWMLVESAGVNDGQGGGWDQLWEEARIVGGGKRGYAGEDLGHSLLSVATVMARQKGG
jgi:hypothetical protein